VIRSILVVGGGSSGYLAALTLKARLPNMPVTMLCSSELGIIQVGEGTTPSFGFHLHNYCRLDIKTFYRLAQPQWKLGIHFQWGPRPYFNYVFGLELDQSMPNLPRGPGYYLDNTDPFEATGIYSGLMMKNKMWLRHPSGGPIINPEVFSYHLENDKLVAYFEKMAAERGIPVIDDIAVDVMQDERGVTGVRLKSGKVLTADLFIDSTGFRALLLGKALQEPYYSYQDSLFCDRACVGGWSREEEPIKPYTTAETMTAGWCWQIEHEPRINRGYVYSSSFISDAEAEAEFRAKNPKITSTRIVPFRTGRYQRFWVKNVIGIGNSSAFVEPLEATSLSSICIQCQAAAEVLGDTELEPTPTAIDVFNRQLTLGFDYIRDFLAVHYRFNKRIDSPFWRECLARAELHGANPAVEFYRENGPSVVFPGIVRGPGLIEFGMEGYLAMLVGQCVPYSSPHKPSAQDRRTWAKLQDGFRRATDAAFSVREALGMIRQPAWNWPENLYAQSRSARQ
jgi:tryptophan halogenase